MSEAHDLVPSFIQPQQLTPAASFVLVPRTVRLQDGTTYTFSDKGLANLVTFFKALGRPLAIDYEHQTLASLPGFASFSSPDGTAPAAGWISALEATPEGLVAKDAQWTPRASKMLASGEYRYFSPVLFWPKGQLWRGDPTAIGPAALTNDPDINGLQALAARCSHAQLRTLLEESEMDLKKLMAELMGLDASAPDEQFATAAKAWVTKAKGAMTASTGHAGLEAEVSALKAQATAAGGEVTALKGQHEQAVTALKTAHASELAATNTTHEQAVTALKTLHAAELAKSTKLVAQIVVDGLEQTGRIAPAAKAELLAKAEKDPELVIGAYKSVPLGAVVPIQTLMGGKGAAGGKIKSAQDSVSASKAYGEAPEERRQLHEMACTYADQHKVSYFDAVAAVKAQQRS